MATMFVEMLADLHSLMQLNLEILFYVLNAVCETKEEGIK
jgi:hypothetical protein